ncbi:hypothetical protein CsSME_00036386 [Camellia sinensis var. sinensis]
MGKYRFLVDSPGAIAKFRKDYNIPDDVHLLLAELDTTPWRKPGFVPFTVISIVEACLRFLVQPFLYEFLRQTRLYPTQLSTNSYRIINGIAKLNHRLGLNLGLAELFHQYSLGQNEDNWVYYLRIRRRREKIIKNTPDKDIKKPKYWDMVLTGIKEQPTLFAPRFGTAIEGGPSYSISNRPTNTVEGGRSG